MEVQAENQQNKLSQLVESNPTWIPFDITQEQFCSPSPAEKFNNIYADNSMSIAAMEFFVRTAQALAFLSKQDQAPASL